MKRLSDYKGEEAIELWADLLEPLSVIFTNEDVKKAQKEGSYILIAKAALKANKTEVMNVLLRVDETPIDGLNILIRLMELFTEIGESEYGQSFFGFAEQDKKE